MFPFNFVIFSFFTFSKTSLVDTMKRNYEIKVHITKKKKKQLRIKNFLFSYHNFFIWVIGLVSRMFASGPGDLGSIPGRVISKTLKMVLDTSFLNTQQYKVCIMGQMEPSWEKSSALSYISV